MIEIGSKTAKVIITRPRPAIFVYSSCSIDLLGQCDLLRSFETVNYLDFCYSNVIGCTCVFLVNCSYCLLPYQQLKMTSASLHMCSGCRSSSSESTEIQLVSRSAWIELLVTDWRWLNSLQCQKFWRNMCFSVILMRLVVSISYLTLKVCALLLNSTRSRWIAYWKSLLRHFIIPLLTKLENLLYLFGKYLNVNVWKWWLLSSQRPCVWFRIHIMLARLLTFIYELAYFFNSLLLLVG